jgi:hypothetical protein
MNEKEYCEPVKKVSLVMEKKALAPCPEGLFFSNF